MPCQPFSNLRNIDPDGTGRSGPANTHVDTDTVFFTFFEYLRKRCPSGFVVENTDGFLKPVDRDQPRRWLDVFLEAADKEGFNCRAVVCNSGEWVDWPRSRPAASAANFSNSVRRFLIQFLIARGVFL